MNPSITDNHSIQAPVEQTPVEQTPVEQTSVEQATVEQATVEQATKLNMTHTKTYYPTGELMEERWLLDEQLHRFNKPAIIKYRKNGTKAEEKFYFKGKQESNKDFPSHLFYNENGIIIKKIWHKRNRIHRKDLPAIIYFGSDGSVQKEVWMHFSKKHRIGAPAVIEFNKGIKTKELYYENDQLHRTDGPAVIEYDNSVIVKEQWIVKNLTHRSQTINNKLLPAIIIHRKDKTLERYFINGIEVLSNKQLYLKNILPTLSDGMHSFTLEEFKETIWVKNHKLTRDEYNGNHMPAHERFLFDKKIQETFYLNGMLHRINAPAIVYFSSSGDIEKEEWFEYGKKALSPKEIKAQRNISIESSKEHQETWKKKLQSLKRH